MNQNLKKLVNKAVLAMICDSTNVFSPGRAGSESRCETKFIKNNEKTKHKKIIVTSFASNVARMETSILLC